MRAPHLPVVIAGPTASGKSALALLLAEEQGGELVCADSRQVYRGMQIGSAGPSDEERARVPHHGFAAVDPEETFDAGRFIAFVDDAVADVAARGRLPILVGGTGLYLRAWRYGLHDVPGTDPAVRARLLSELDAEGPRALHDRLRAVDPAGADAIAPSDPVRIVRALEVHEVTGQPASALRRSHLAAPPRVKARFFLLDADLAWLTPRIQARAETMFRRGLLEEAARLRTRVGPGHRLLSTMGYEEALDVVDGRLPLPEAVRRAAQRQRQYARRQRTWFKKEPWWIRLDPADPGHAQALLSTVVGVG